MVCSEGGLLSRLLFKSHSRHCDRQVQGPDGLDIKTWYYWRPQ